MSGDDDTRDESGDTGNPEPREEFAVNDALTNFLPELAGYIRRRTGGTISAKESSSDLVQSVCREIYQHLDRFQHGDEKAFKQWLFRTAERKIIDRHRYYTAGRRDAGRESPADAEADGARHRVTPSRYAMAREELDRVQAALTELPPHYREVIVLARILDLSHAEVAERLGKTESAVRSVLHRALAEVAKILARKA